MRISDWSSDVCSSDLGGRAMALHILERVRAFNDLIEGALHRHPHSFHGCVEQVRLVLKVPIDRTSCHASGARNLVERGPRDAAFEKYALGSIKDAFAGL